jgi:hypothetical protein
MIAIYIANIGMIYFDRCDRNCWWISKQQESIGEVILSLLMLYGDAVDTLTNEVAKADSTIKALIIC